MISGDSRKFRETWQVCRWQWWPVSSDGYGQKSELVQVVECLRRDIYVMFVGAQVS